jgi:hypothetical protein
MTLLSICQDTLKEIGEVEVPATIIGNSNRTAVDILALAQREGEELSRRYLWEEILTEHTFSTVANQEGYTSPTDFNFMVQDSFHDRTDRAQMIGPTNPQDWQRLKASDVAVSRTYYYRFRGSQILLYPTPTSVDSLAYEYVSLNWCQDSSGTGQSAWAADTDTGILSEFIIRAGLRWRWKASKGLHYAEDQRSYEIQVQQAIARSGSAGSINMGGAKLPTGSSSTTTGRIWDSSNYTWGS